MGEDSRTGQEGSVAAGGGRTGGALCGDDVGEHQPEEWHDLASVLKDWPGGSVKERVKGAVTVTQARDTEAQTTKGEAGR